MALSQSTWHTVAQLVVLVSALACSGSEVSPSDTDTAHLDDADAIPNAEDTERSDDGARTEPAPFEPHATVVRLVNGAAETRSRVSACAGPRDIVGIRPAAIATEPPTPTCARVDCDTTRDNEVLAPENQCSGPACAPLRVDRVPGAVDVDYEWDGVYWTLTERNCYDATTPESGTPMLVRACFGRPAAGDFDVQDVTCTDFPFVYGVPFVEVVLQ